MDEELENKSKRIREMMVYSKLEKPITDEISELLQMMAEFSTGMIEERKYIQAEFSKERSERESFKAYLTKELVDWKEQLTTSMKMNTNEMLKHAEEIKTLNSQALTYSKQVDKYTQNFVKTMKMYLTPNAFMWLFVTLAIGFSLGMLVNMFILNR